MKNEPNIIVCPLVDEEIDIGDCAVINDVAEDVLIEECVDERFRKEKYWKITCKKCKWHNLF